MVASINASTSAGVVTTADTSGILALQTAGTTALTLDASQNATFAGTLTTTGITNSGVATATRFNPTGSSVTGNGMYLPAANSLGLSTNGTNAVYIDSSQNVGIGTSSPTGKLHVSAPASTQYGTFDAVTATSAFINYKVGGTAYGYLGDASGLVTGGTAGDLALRFSGAMVFSGGANERMRIDSSGNVGINKTPNNLAKLTVRSSASQFPQLFLEQDNTEDGWLYLADSTDGSMAFKRRQSGATSEKARFDINGNLLVGTTSNGTYGEKFNVTTGSSSQVIMNLVATGTGAFGAIKFRNGSGEIGSISYGASNVTYNTSSDYRLKHDIQPMTGALEKLLLLKPCTYKWNINDAQGQGFIAHELAEVVPDCVSGEKDAVDANGEIQPQGIDTSFLVATLTAAIQELKAINDTQAETINALTARIVALESK